MRELPTGHVRQVFADLATRGRTTTDDLVTQVSELTDPARTRIVALPRAVIDEVRRRVNVLDLATKHDVEVQTRLARIRMSRILKDFLDEQQSRERALLESLRADLREELQTFAAAIDDDLFTTDSKAAVPERMSDELDDLYDFDDEGDDIDENGYGNISLDEIDLTPDGGGMLIRDRSLDLSDG